MGILIGSENISRWEKLMTHVDELRKKERSEKSESIRVNNAIRMGICFAFYDTMMQYARDHEMNKMMVIKRDHHAPLTHSFMVE